MNYALIPARIGSKGVPKKNLKKIGNKSLIEIAIDSATGCALIDKIFVSTDDSEIKSKASSLGCIVHNRSLKTSSDESTASMVIKEFIDDENISSDSIIVYLQPTSPFRSKKTIISAIEATNRNKKTSLTVVPTKKQPEKLLVKKRNGLHAVKENLANENRQKLPLYFEQTGGVYVFYCKEFRKNNQIDLNGSNPIVVNEIEAIDIDTKIDLEICRSLHEKYGV